MGASRAGAKGWGGLLNLLLRAVQQDLPMVVQTAHTEGYRLYLSVYQYDSQVSLYSISVDENRLIEAILMSTHNIQFIKKKLTLSYPKSAVMGYFPRDSRKSSKQLLADYFP